MRCRGMGLFGGTGLLAAALAIAIVPAHARQQPQLQQPSPARQQPHTPRQSLAPRQPLLGAGLPPASLGGPCLRLGQAYLRAHIRGAVRLDVDLRGPGLTCEGGPRLDGSGLRMGFEGRVGPGGRRMRMVFGIDGAKEARSGRELPTNLTVIFEGEKLLFATQGDGNCTVDRLTQHRIVSDGHPGRAYRIVAHGFCIAPANDLGGHRRILVTTFDFAGRADFNAG